MTTLPPDDDEIMPPIKNEDKDYPLRKPEQEILKQWIKEGAKWPDGLTLAVETRLPKKIAFEEHVQPIIEHHLSHKFAFIPQMNPNRLQIGGVVTINGSVFLLMSRTIGTELQGWLRPAGYVETKNPVVSYTNVQKRIDDLWSQVS